MCSGCLDNRVRSGVCKGGGGCVLHGVNQCVIGTGSEPEHTVTHGAIVKFSTCHWAYSLVILNSKVYPTC